MHASIQVRDAFADTLRPQIAAVAGRVYASRLDPFEEASEVPAIVVDAPSSAIMTEGLSAGRPGLQTRTLTLPITILLVATGDVQAKLYEIAAEIEQVIGSTPSPQLKVRSCLGPSIGDPTVVSQLSEDGMIVGLTLRYTLTVATREGAPTTLIGA